jgi:AsmA protein
MHFCMKLNLKTIGIGAAAILGLLMLTVAAFFLFFPKQLAAREAERRIEEATGRELTLGENIEVAFWPALGFSVDQASLSNPQGFASTEPFLAAERIVFAVRVMPLLAGRVEVSELLFDGARLNLVATADGAGNWAFPMEETPEQQTTLDDLRLDDVRLNNAAIRFLGAAGEAPLALDDVDASLALQSLDQPATLNAAFDYLGERLDVAADIGLPRAVLERGETPISARVRAAPLAAEFNGAFNAETGALTGRFNASGASLRRLLAWIGSPLSEGGGFGAFRLAAQMAHEGERTALTDATLSLDSINATGRLTLIAPPEGRLRIEGALAAGTIDVNPYLSPSTQTEGVEADAAWPTTPLDLSGLRALDANLTLTLDALKFQRMTFSNVALNLRLANGAADARLNRIALYDGAGTARLIADGSGRMPRIAFEIDAQNVQAETLLRDAIGFDKIVGRGRLRASMVGQGASQAALMQSLDGSASFAFNDGQWKGVNLAQVARTVQQALTGAAAGQGGATDFAELSANFAIADGVAATNDLKLLNPLVRLEGQGLIDIGAQSIDMRIAPRAVRSLEGQGGDAGIAGLGVPFRVSGPWSNVRFAPALGEIVQNELRARAQQVLRNQPQGSVLGQLGETLFGRAPAPAAATPTSEPQAAAGEAPAPATAPPPPPAERPRNPLEDILRRATQPRAPATAPTPPAEPAPAPSP